MKTLDDGGAGGPFESVEHPTYTWCYKNCARIQAATHQLCEERDRPHEKKITHICNALDWGLQHPRGGGACKALRGGISKVNFPRFLGNLSPKMINGSNTIIFPQCDPWDVPSKEVLWGGSPRSCNRKGLQFPVVIDARNISSFCVPKPAFTNEIRSKTMRWTRIFSGGITDFVQFAELVVHKLLLSEGALVSMFVREAPRSGPPF